MQAIILAAGMGKRLKDLTQDNTKCMVRVNGVTLIERMLGQLDRLGLSQIVLVVGYEGQKLMDYVSTLGIKTPIRFVDNPIYDRTNNIYSLSLVSSELEEDDTLLLESDLIFEDSLLNLLIEDPRDTLALVDKYERWMDGTVVEIDPNGTILSFTSGKKLDFENTSDYYKTVNIYKFSKDFSRTHYVPFLTAYIQTLGNNEYYEQVLRVLTMIDEPGIEAKPLSGQLWYEIDDLQDLDIASSLFSDDPAERLDLLQRRYGGYWRYPKMVDFCYLVNPYYPPVRMVSELKANFETLLTQYPSGMAVNSLLAAKNFAVHQDQIVAGNGAAELIKPLMAMTPGKIGMVFPTFEEYPNRTGRENVVAFTPSNDDYSYSADDLIDFFGSESIGTLLVINPDNPTGNYIPRNDVLRLAEWGQALGVRVIIDESFVDFADEVDATLIEEEVLRRFPELVLVKSISKSFGIPGLRLGIVASGDKNLIEELKKDVPIWNINSFAEFYMQIAEKYQSDYADGLVRLRQARKQLSDGLSAIPGVRVIPSQANYVMIELMGGMTALECTSRLLNEHDLLIKDLSSKITRDGKQYLRIAVRDEADNLKLLVSLAEVLAK